jgi:solute carrier family 25 oxoglutarate transporter 11
MTATCVIQPVDMLKVRIQIQAEENGKLKAAGKPIVKSTSPFAVFPDMLRTGGVAGLYKGLDAALTRQVFYTTTRLGIYNKMFNSWKESKGSELNFF